MPHSDLEFSSNNPYFQKLVKDHTFSLRNADPKNWNWKRDKSIWEIADERLQDFHRSCIEGQAGSLLDGQSLLIPQPFHGPLRTLTSESIFIRSCYVRMFDVVWAQSVSRKGRNGVIITGQPGTGKTLFNFYLLVRLLLLKQVVLYSPNGEYVYLFLHNCVYKLVNDTSIQLQLPEPVPGSKVFIWCLFDIIKREEPNPFFVEPPCFPVQTCSPDPIQFKAWEETYKPLLTGLPLWTHEELDKGLLYQKDYPRLMETLQAFYARTPNDDYRLVGFPGARELLDDRFCEELPSPEEAVDYLLAAAIERFGNSARDVFDGVFEYDNLTITHQRYFYNQTYADLRDGVAVMSNHTDASFDMSNYILVISPVYSDDPLKCVNWKVDFKSDWVASNILLGLNAQGDLTLEQINFFQNVPGAQGLAGRLLKLFAHQTIANTTGNS